MTSAPRAVSSPPGSEYEGAFISGLLTRGYAVAMTDYQGLGTPGTHTYMVREAQAHAVLDMVRAAQRLPGTGLPSERPGHARRLQPGWWCHGSRRRAGADLRARSPPAEVPSPAPCPPSSGPSPTTSTAASTPAFALYAVAGQSAAYGLDLDSFLNARGTSVIAAVKGECVAESIALHAFTRSSDLTRDGRTLTAARRVGALPLDHRRPAHRRGLHSPPSRCSSRTPVLDDVIPYAVGRGLARDWCDRGANVAFSANITPTHVGGAVPSFAKQYAFLEARVAGLPQVSDCWWL